MKDVLKVVLRRNWRRFTQTWKLYKRSKVGLMGLGIMIGFLVMAIFAPILSPYDPDFAAPNEDVFVADFAEMSLEGSVQGEPIKPLEEEWHEPVAELSPPPDSTLESLLVYSSEGHAIRFDVGYVSLGNAVGIELKTPSYHSVPMNTTYMEYVFFRRDYYVVVAGTTYWELRYSDMFPFRDYEIGFQPLYYSNLWWVHRFDVVPEEIVCFAVANETKVTMLAKAHPGIGELNEKFFPRSVTINVPGHNSTGLRIVGNPIVLFDRTLDNGTLLVVPTNEALLAYEIRSNITVFGVKDVWIGGLKWYVDFDVLGSSHGTTIIPVEGHTIAMEGMDPRSSQSKDRIILGSNPGGDNAGQLFAFWRNGTFDWWSTLTVPEMRALEVTGVHPSDKQGFIATGSQGAQSIVAGIVANTGKIDGNMTYYSLVDGRIVTAPTFVSGNRRYIFSTDQDKVYMLQETVRPDVVFSIEKGIDVPVSYLGNIMTQHQITGNYYGIVTKEGTFFAQSLGGAYVAPLPPGVGKSGNWYILGTDVFGHDVFTQLLYATQNELLVGLTSAIIAVGIGTLVGLVAGYFGGIIDSILMRFTDMFLTLPILVIALLLAAVLGPSLINLIIVIAVFSWAGISRVIRAQTLSLKERDFIKAAKVAGAGHRQILFRHLAPNVLPFTFLYMAYTISGAIVTEAILSFLGMGDPTSITWGMMLQYLRISGHTLDAPWWFLPPGIAITLLSLSFYLIGRAFDEVVNPRLRAR